jgi:hypothetical protein
MKREFQVLVLESRHENKNITDGVVGVGLYQLQENAVILAIARPGTLSITRLGAELVHLHYLLSARSIAYQNIKIYSEKSN